MTRKGRRRPARNILSNRQILLPPKVPSLRSMKWSRGDEVMSKLCWIIASSLEDSLHLNRPSRGTKGLTLEPCGTSSDWLASLQLVGVVWRLWLQNEEPPECEPDILNKQCWKIEGRWRERELWKFLRRRRQHWWKNDEVKTTMVKKWWSLGGYLNRNCKPLSRTRRSPLKGDWWVVMWIGFIRNLRCQIDTPIKWLLKIRVWADREQETHIPYHIQVRKSRESWKTHHQKDDAWTENYGHDENLKRHDRENHNKYPLRKTFPEEINQTNWILITEQTSRIRELGG